jgi:hypothetical protein
VLNTTAWCDRDEAARAPGSDGAFAIALSVLELFGVCSFCLLACVLLHGVRHHIVCYIIPGLLAQDKLYDLLNNAPLLYGERQNVIRAFRGGVGAIPFYCDGLTGM